MVTAKTLTTALSRRRCREANSPNCAACAQRRLQAQRQLGAEDHQSKRKLRDHQEIPLILSVFMLRPKVTRLAPFCNKVLAD